MFVHIGNNIILEEKDIIGIYNIESMIQKNIKI